MKAYITQRELREDYIPVVVSYNLAQYLLSREQAEAYTCGVYGWNADVYFFDDVALVTGYRPIGRKVRRETEERIEKLAHEICKRDTDTRQAELRALIDELIEDTLYRKEKR